MINQEYEHSTPSQSAHGMEGKPSQRGWGVFFQEQYEDKGSWLHNPTPKYFLFSLSKKDILRAIVVSELGLTFI
jgi:hypothetical protein